MKAAVEKQALKFGCGVELLYLLGDQAILPCIVGDKIGHISLLAHRFVLALPLWLSQSLEKEKRQVQQRIDGKRRRVHIINQGTGRVGVDLKIRDSKKMRKQL